VIEVKRHKVTLSVMLMLIIAIFSGCLDEPKDEQISNIIYVDSLGGKDFTSIQMAINNASEGDTIMVSPGNYSENLHIHKSIILKGSENVNIYASKLPGDRDTIVYISADNCTFEGFNLENIEIWEDKIAIHINSSGSRIVGNKISEFEYGIYLENSANKEVVYSNIYISSNEINNCTSGIYFYANAKENTIENNDIIDNFEGIHFKYCVNNTIKNNYIHSSSQYGMIIERSSDGNKVSRNIVTECITGIRFKGVNYNEFFLNRFERNEKALYACCGAGSNTIYKNTLIDNDIQAEDGLVNNWDNGKFGNYWDDYTGSDSNGDGIGDTPYDIPGGSRKDHFPLMEPLI
jgi:parallel beta-helix repeat protein